MSVDLVIEKRIEESVSMEVSVYKVRIEHDDVYNFEASLDNDQDIIVDIPIESALNAISRYEMITYLEDNGYKVVEQ